MQQDLENLPIDIHYNKLLDWLINRRHCQQQWQAVSLIIREKINKAIQDMPVVDEITKLLQGTYINYFHCQRIVELLKNTECGEKNIFGQYSSQKMKDWADIIKLYEKDGVFLAETAQMLMRNVNYEVPALKKQIAKCQQIQKECDRKEADYASKAAELRKKYESSCKQLGIKGEKIKSELSALVKDLPTVYDRVAETSKSLQTAIDYYQDFTSFVMDSKVDEADCLPMLKFIQNHGNVTTYEWRTGSKPVTIQEDWVVIDTKDEEDLAQNADDIDWGDTGQNGGTAEIDLCEDIDFDISGITLESGGISEGQNDIDLSVEQLGEEIDWGITGETVQVQETPETEEGVASGEDALSLLDNPRTRNLFIDDLLELEAFLTQRLLELKEESNVLSVSQFQTAPTSVQLDSNKVSTLATEVKDILAQLTTVQIQHLMLIRNSPRYVDRLKESLCQTLTLADKMVFYEKEMVVRRKESVEEERDLVPKSDVLIERTKEIQKQMEGEIAKKYKNRRVNIMGEINTI